MHRLLSLLVLGLLLTISGCDSNEPPKAQAPPVTPQAAVAAEEKAPAPAVEEADKAAAAGQPVSAAVQEATDKASATAAEAGTAVVAGATAVAGQVKEKTVAATESITKAADQTVAGAAAVAASATAAIAPAADKMVSATVPQELVLEASYGNITFSHAMHAEAYKCSTCHGDKTPARFGLTKEVAHVLCKDCHKQEGAPNACNDCHKK